MKQRAYALATILILLGVAMFGAASIVTISTLETKISRSQQSSVNAYYVAEAGIQDGLWRLNNTSAYSSALVAGTLNATYTATNFPQTGQSFTVTLTTSAQGAGYGTIDVTGTVSYGTFTAKRRIKINVFQGTIPSSIGTNALFGGSTLGVTNGASALNVVGGGIYSTGNITFSSTTVTATGQAIGTAGTYSVSGSTITSSSIHSTNLPTAPATISTPSFDFTYYSTNYNNKYTAAQFQALFSGATVTLPGPVTYVSGSLAFGNWAKNKTLNITGMLVVNGSISLPGTTTGFAVNVTDPGNGKSGIYALTTATIGTGSWNVNGLLYASGNVGVTSPSAFNINGALVSGGAITITTGAAATLTYNNTRVGASLGSSAPLSVNVQHWEEEY